MIPPDWMLKSDTITTQDERVRQAQKAYQQALTRIEEDPENKALRDDLDEAAKFLVNQVRWLDQERKNKVFDRTSHEGMTAEDWKTVSNARGSAEEIQEIWDKVSSGEAYELTQEDLGKLTGPDPHEQMAKQVVNDYISIGSQEPKDKSKTKAGRKEEFIQWKGTHEELVLLLEILKDNGLIHYEQFPLTKICGLFVDNQFQNLKRGSVKRKNYVVKANREELKEKKLKLINKINRISN